MNPNKVAFANVQRSAIHFANVYHGTQRRQDTVLPYIVHPIEVASIIGRFYPDNQDLIIAGYLHDVLEDTHCTEERMEQWFGKTITALVKGVTAKDEDFGTWRERRQHQIDKLKECDLDILRLKACDMLSNSLAIGFDYRYRPSEGYPKFRKNPEDVRWYYSEAWNTIDGRLWGEKITYALRDANAVWAK